MSDRTSGVTLVKDGKWLVPPEQRPKDWERILPEPSAQTSALDRVVVETQARDDAPVPDPIPEPIVAARQHQPKVEPWDLPAWKNLKSSIFKSGRSMGVDGKLMGAGLVLASGMFTRTGPVIRKMTGVTNEKTYVNRCYELGLWSRDNRSVVMGDMNDKSGDLEFWLISMAITGEIIRHSNGTFQAIQT